MHVIDLHTDDWKSIVDFYDAIGRAGHEHSGRTVANARNVNGLLELLVWDVQRGGDAPDAIRVSGVCKLPDKIRDEVILVQWLLTEARAESIARRGFDVEVDFEVVP